jgi:hypothetical protein
LFENPIAQELLDILENEGKVFLQHLDRSSIAQVFDPIIPYSMRDADEPLDFKYRSEDLLGGGIMNQALY